MAELRTFSGEGARSPSRLEVLEVSAEVDLSGGDGRVMQLVARHGIEPPTPAFSGPPTD